MKNIKKGIFCFDVDISLHLWTKSIWNQCGLRPDYQQLHPRCRCLTPGIPEQYFSRITHVLNTQACYYLKLSLDEEQISFLARFLEFGVNLCICIFQIIWAEVYYILRYYNFHKSVIFAPFSHFCHIYEYVLLVWIFIWHYWPLPPSRSVFHGNPSDFYLSNTLKIDNRKLKKYFLSVIQNNQY